MDSRKHKIPAHDHLDSREFIIAVKRLADSLSYGSDSSPFLGTGSDYVQSRIYQPGDPVKLIDWRITARTGKVYVKEFEAPKQMPIYLLLDTSASMCVSSIGKSKYAWAVQLATGIALAAQERMSPVGVLGCGESELHVKPTLARNTVYQWSHHLRYHDFHEKTSLTESIRQLIPSLKNKCLIFVLSDLHDNGVLDALKLLAQEHDTVVLQLQDPAEKGSIGGGVFRAQEVETKKMFVAHGHSKWFDHEALGHELTHCGVDHLLLPTGEPFLHRLRNFLKARDYFGKGAR